MKKRSFARELALQFLYQLDSGGDSDPDPFLRAQTKDSGIRKFAVRLINGVLEYKTLLDEKISLCSNNWMIERMAILDKNVIRIAAFEILYINEIPDPVSINEAVELAKKYGQKESSSFVNGILDNISRKREEQQQKEN